MAAEGTRSGSLSSNVTVVDTKNGDRISIARQQTEAGPLSEFLEKRTETPPKYQVLLTEKEDGKIVSYQPGKGSSKYVWTGPLGVTSLVFLFDTRLFWKNRSVMSEDVAEPVWSEPPSLDVEDEGDDTASGDAKEIFRNMVTSTMNKFVREVDTAEHALSMMDQGQGICERLLSASLSQKQAVLIALKDMTTHVARAAKQFNTFHAAAKTRATERELFLSKHSETLARLNEVAVHNALQPRGQPRQLMLGDFVTKKERFPDVNQAQSEHEELSQVLASFEEQMESMRQEAGVVTSSFQNRANELVPMAEACVTEIASLSKTVKGLEAEFNKDLAELREAADDHADLDTLKRAGQNSATLYTKHEEQLPKLVAAREQMKAVVARCAESKRRMQKLVQETLVRVGEFEQQARKALLEEIPLRQERCKLVQISFMPFYRVHHMQGAYTDWEKEICRRIRYHQTVLECSRELMQRCENWAGKERQRRDNFNKSHDAALPEDFSRLLRDPIPVIQITPPARHSSLPDLRGVDDVAETGAEDIDPFLASIRRGGGASTADVEAKDREIEALKQQVANLEADALVFKEANTKTVAEMDTMRKEKEAAVEKSAQAAVGEIEMRSKNEELEKLVAELRDEVARQAKMIKSNGPNMMSMELQIANQKERVKELKTVLAEKEKRIEEMLTSSEQVGEALNILDVPVRTASGTVDGEALLDACRQRLHSLQHARVALAGIDESTHGNIVLFFLKPGDKHNVYQAFLPGSELVQFLDFDTVRIIENDWRGDDKRFPRFVVADLLMCEKQTITPTNSRLFMLPIGTEYLVWTANIMAADGFNKLVEPRLDASAD